MKAHLAAASICSICSDPLRLLLCNNRQVNESNKVVLLGCSLAHCLLTASLRHCLLTASLPHCSHCLTASLPHCLLTAYSVPTHCLLTASLPAHCSLSCTAVAQTGSTRWCRFLNYSCRVTRNRVVNLHDCSDPPLSKGRGKSNSIWKCLSTPTTHCQHQPTTVSTALVGAQSALGITYRVHDQPGESSKSSAAAGVASLP